MTITRGALDINGPITEGRVLINAQMSGFGDEAEISRALPVLTQRQHSSYSAAIRPGAFARDAILRRTMSM